MSTVQTPRNQPRKPLPQLTPQQQLTLPHPHPRNEEGSRRLNLQPLRRKRQGSPRKRLNNCRNSRTIRHCRWNCLSLRNKRMRHTQLKTLLLLLPITLLITLLILQPITLRKNLCKFRTLPKTTSWLTQRMKLHRPKWWRCLRRKWSSTTRMPTLRHKPTIKERVLTPKANGWAIQRTAPTSSL